ncbi:MAG: ATP-binding protein, partial [Verrucomicrobia bacterium]|nr:ATP-binding protein [Verrucomicrobiota bacterium]
MQERNSGTPQRRPGVSGEYIVLSIQDNGTGIAPEIQSRIFEPFFTTKSSGKGYRTLGDQQSIRLWN